MRIKFVLLLSISLLITTSCAFPFTAGNPSEIEESSISSEKETTTEENIQPEETVATNAPINPSALIQPDDFIYLGAFRLPDDGDRPRTFEYGGNAMTYFPSENNADSQDGFPGSLFIMGHDRLAYGEMPDGNQIAEVSIPSPVISKDVYSLPVAEFIQPFANVAEGMFTGLDEIPRVGMAYLDTPQTGPLVHISWGAHFQEEESNKPSHSWFETDLSSPNPAGEWWIENTNLYSVNGYMFTIPENWAASFINGFPLATGRYRDGGWSGMGPSLYAYQPWVDDNGTPAENGASLHAVPLLQYSDSYNGENFSHALNGYSHADEWGGGEWLTIPDGRSAVIFAGTKATGNKTWYGWQNPAGAEYPCIETAFRDEFVTCRNADHTPCPDEDLKGCSNHNDYRGWWSSEFRAWILLYNPDDLARVALGELEPWQPQPYAVLDIDDLFFHNPEGVEEGMLGAESQQLGLIGDIAYDRENSLIYVLELFAEGAKPVVHVWQLPIN